MAEDELRRYLRRTVADLLQVRQELSALKQRAAEPIAVIGMACRFPGGIASPEDLWRVVSERRHVRSPFPADRGWRAAADHDEPGNPTVGLGGFLDDATGFDAAFFGISDSEAAAMDPQQRLMLEVAWEAFERGHLDPTTLRGSDTGVFAAVSDQVYSDWCPDWDGYETYYVLGNQVSLATGRIAYALGLDGPAITVDTACSGALVALHQAVEALRAGSCSLALTGGITVITQPTQFVAFSRQRALAPDGICKPYATAADGTAWSEGVGLVVLERLSDARRHGHPVLAVVRGSAVNSDGASNGLTAPNGQAQQRVIRRALVAAGLSAAEIDVIEGHGTGTTLGDPIEAQALLATYGRHRALERPVWLGSIKSNIGHTQSAAGAAGLIKMIMAMRHGVVPATLHVDRPSEHIDWSAGQLRLATESVPWPETGNPRRAAISAFGFSGTNAHVVVEYDTAGYDSEQRDFKTATGTAAEDITETARADSTVADSSRLPTYPVVVSARGAAALREQSARLVATIGIENAAAIVDLGYASVTTRAVFDHRAVLIAGETERLRAAAEAVAQGAGSSDAVVGAVSSGRLGVLLPGQGSQRPGTGRQLYELFPAFAAAFDELCAAFDPHLDRPLREIVFDADSETLDRTEFTQPALFSVQVAIWRLLESWGVTADFLLGHSIGELSAAHLGGVIALPDAAAVVAARGRLMQRLGPGAMLAVRASRAEAEEALGGYRDRVSVAADNGPNATVLSGDEAAVLELARYWRGRGRRTRRLGVARAFHSPQLDGLLADFRAVLAGVELKPSSIPLVSNVTGLVATSAQLSTPEYWVRQARGTVLFHDSVRCLRDAGVDTFLEIGSGDVLSGMTAECVADDRCAILPGLRGNGTEARDLLGAVAGIWVRGAAVAWPEVFTGSGARTVDLPTYAFQHRRYWHGTQHYWCASGGGATTAHFGVDPEAAQAAPEQTDPVAGLVAALAEFEASERGEYLLAAVRAQLTAILADRVEVTSIDDDTGVLATGLTSLSVLELRSRISGITGLVLPVSAFLDNPTPRTLAALLDTELAAVAPVTR
ncbi:type I polyketide synthase [Nocardia uniformis]|uniref:Type I polyketide synthase n=1 Tax=Nocardia uniformis TaxID=53432 RepID=A0A849BUW1_9NOCA|nr:type I polyketide synthase [Nocardia uniformis]NNH68848.1 type I polyketide synthase [Nocardia uniformis]